MKLNFLLLFTILIPLFCSADSDLEIPSISCNCCDNCPKLECPPCEENAASGPWSNNISLGYNKTDGNSDTSLLNIKLKNVYEKNDDVFRFEAEHSFGENDDDTNVDFTKVLTEYKQIQSEIFYVGFGIQYLRDEIADVKYRININPAIGYYIFRDEDDGFLSVEAGPTYLFEEVDDISDDYLAPRIANRFEYQISPSAKVFQNAELIISSEDSDNYIIQAEAGIETTITETLNLIFKVRDNYDNEPAAESKRNDLVIMTALGVEY